MRYHFFLHYGWFFQNLGKEAVRTFMHTTVSGLNYQVLKWALFDIKMIVKRGLEFFILIFFKPLWSCCCPVLKNHPERLIWPGYNNDYAGACGVYKKNIKIYNTKAKTK